ncbi:MAG: UDP-glucose 4-epimerase GalE [Bacteroidales bacterium]|jgi:UDP-glucose 4-epimerase|nr:UDP-glucose 4-epimerase GalE [Bacteroidales bacterium]
MKTILVTGGTGYIGSHTVVELQEAGFEVVIVDNLSNSHAEVIDSIQQISGIRPKFEKVDLKDRGATLNVFKKHSKIEAIIHFAALKAVGESVEIPLEYYKNNIDGLIHLLEGMQENNVMNLVFSSSCTVYGEPDNLPVDEKAPIKKANSPYGNTKQIDEEIMQDFGVANSGYSFIALRYFNPIGAHPTALIGELPLGTPNNLIPFITQTAIGLRDELKVFGDDYNTPDGSAIRDYINVVDLAKAHVVAIKRLLEEKNKSGFEVFNLGTGKGNSVFEVIKSFEKVTGKPLKYNVVGKRRGDIEQVYADTCYANDELGWKAEKNLEETLLSAWKWQQYYQSKQQ